jgi:hypothetical protein
LNIRCYWFKWDVMLYNISIFEIYFAYFRKLLCDLFETDNDVFSFLPILNPPFHWSFPRIGHPLKVQRLCLKEGIWHFTIPIPRIMLKF